VTADLARTAPIRAVFFDAVGTILHPEPSAALAYHTIGARRGSRLGAEVVRARFRKAFARQEEEDRSAGLRTDEGREVARWRNIVTEVLDDIGDPEGCFQELYAHFAEPGAWRCDAEAGTVLRALAERGYRVGLASNFDHRLRGLVGALPELAPVAHLVISSEIGWRKPSPHFFAAVCRAAEVEAKQVLLVGDDEVNDLGGARAAGLLALLLEPGRSGAGDRIASLREVLERLP
jgi:putative hydrolase of the HAD superfamily